MKTPKRLILILCLLLSNLVTHAQSVGDKAPDFTLDKLNGGSFKLSQQSDKVVFIFFFGSACPHCLANGPNTQSGIYEVYKDNPDFVAVGLDTWDRNSATVTNFKEQTKIEYELCLNASSVQASYSTTYDRIVIVDKEGTIRYKASANATTEIVKAASDVIATYLSAGNGGGGGDGDDGDGGMVLSTIEPSTADLLLYPVPAHDYLTIESDKVVDRPASVKLYDITGKYVKTQGFLKSIEGQLTINVSDQPTGLNILEITFEDQSTIRRMFIKE
ncbi:redoxin domain-containing protein [Reichenbachiella agariperforans]|uniref:T9SS type A sorting domain-containing protein n=1 Tax=Reichenbachiella agariperforans TaxID=156994 RepID=UPI001C082CFD|nr:redoxin domain-containing protein [Reichenbachiella agariperforans]MBU2916146.1 redoxin domain-containing protein [Reichenbachiella agariperforans]